MIWDKVIRGATREVLRQEGNVEEWARIYRGDADYIEYTEKNIDGETRKRRRNCLNPAKLISQEMASLVFSELPRVEGSTVLEQVLAENKFWDHQVPAFERQCALGAQAIKIYVQDGQIYYDYVPANMVVPISWDNRRVTEAAFLDFRIIGGKQYIRVEEHRRNYPPKIIDGEYKIDPDTGGLELQAEPVGYRISSSVYKQEGDKLKPVDVASIMPEYSEAQVLDMDNPPFVYIKNPVANNWSSQTPVGMSLYGNSKDTLRSIDISFDNMAEAPLLCRPRILVSDQLISTKIDPETGRRIKFFDESDRAFQAAPFGDPDKDIPLKDMTVPLQHDQIRKQIQTELDLLSMQIGLSAGTISFDGSGGFKTATEVVSENSKTYKTRQKYVNALTEAYQQLFDATQEVARLYGIGTPQDYTIIWEDSIIEDKNAKANYWLTLSSSGIIPAYRVLMELEGYEEEEAKRLADEANADNGPGFPGA